MVVIQMHLFASITICVRKLIAINIILSFSLVRSEWNPKPTSFRGERQIIQYKNILYGQGSQQPPFPAPTIWDVELLSLR